VHAKPRAHEHVTLLQTKHVHTSVHAMQLHCSACLQVVLTNEEVVSCCLQRLLP